MQKAARLPSIDMLRGFVIAIMALDHVRDFFGHPPFNIENLDLTTPGWFWNRWITHICAPVFVVLAGSSAFLRGQHTGTAALSRYLGTRGLMIVALEITWISFSWQLAYNVMILQVLWALGAGMLLLAALVWLPRAAIIAVAAALILPHNLLDGIHSDSVWWTMWHQGGFFRFEHKTLIYGIMFKYPLMPWLGLIAAGYALGPVFLLDAARRQRLLLGMSGILLATFVILRIDNLYGDPLPWSAQGKGWMFDLMSFVSVQKYPPSLLYLCITVGIGLTLLVLFERVRPNKLLLLFGGSPMFFYVVHVALIHVLGNAYVIGRFGALPDFSGPKPVWPPGYEGSLVVVYAAWIGILVIMACLTVLWKRRRSALLRDPLGVPGS